MVNRVKLTNTQLNKLKSAAKNKTRTVLRITKKNFQDDALPHELLLNYPEIIFKILLGCFII